MAGPIHPRLLRRAKATRTFLIASVAVGVATAVLLILQARLLSDWITRAFAELVVERPGTEVADEFDVDIDFTDLLRG